ncbi:MAG TPA: hypothetical protein VJ260_02045, partial [Vicinamibacterales bacterium]|nr:hypothetical protein [Vicinamibacterales bacterium]
MLQNVAQDVGSPWRDSKRLLGEHDSGVHQETSLSTEPEIAICDEATARHVLGDDPQRIRRQLPNDGGDMFVGQMLEHLLDNDDISWRQRISDRVEQMELDVWR